MAGIDVNSQYLHDLRKRIREAGSTSKELNSFFVNGADNLGREADVARLQDLTFRLRQQLKEVESSEDDARVARSKADAIGDAGGLLGMLIGSVTGKHDWEEKFEKELNARRLGSRQSFGTIMICIGKGGLPEDAWVVSISKLARTQKLSETTIIHKFQESGTLLFTPDEFWQLIEELMRDTHDGKRKLPISYDQLVMKLPSAKKVNVKSQNGIDAIQILPVIASPSLMVKKCNIH